MQLPLEVAEDHCYSVSMDEQEVREQKTNFILDLTMAT